LLGKHDAAAARRSLERAAELDRTSPEAVTGLVVIDLSHKDLRAARARVEAFLARSPAAPVPLLTAAKLYGLMGDKRAVEETLTNALKTDPSNPEIYDRLGRIYVSQGRMADAKKQYTEVARLEPRSVSANTMLGWLCYAERDVPEARKWWEKAIKIDSGAAAAANNLAWVYAESGGDLDVALQLAQTAKGKYPGQPEVNDTLGWIYYRKDLNTQAIFYLEQSVERDPTSALYQYHLGMAYAQKGEDAKARRVLQRALQLDPKFPEANQARKTLASLVY
jgi:Tfp pilus assembly protein PilF